MTLRCPFALSCVLLLCGPARAGDIVGFVKAEGVPAGDAPSSGGNYQSRRYKFAEKVDYEHLQDFVVYIDRPAEDFPGAAAPPAPRTITQRDASFDPHVMPIVVGTVIRWPNADDIFHNVFSMSEPAKFDLGTYLKEKTPEVTFDQVGQVDVFCSIHSHMHCIIFVVPNPYFKKVDAGHRYEISGIPAGTYRVKAWQERLPTGTKVVTVPEEGQVRVDFVLGFSGLPRY
jgi:plastocyanin